VGGNQLTLLKGLATILVGIASYWMVHDFPDNAKFLSDDERKRVIRRLALDQQASAHHERFNMKFLWESIKDWKTYAFSIIYMGTDGSLYAFSLFLPTIIKQLGYSSTRANLLSVPPYAAAAISTILVGWYADRTRKRGLCNIVMSLVGIVGFIMLISSQTPGVKYAGTFLGAIGIYPTIANTIAWCSNHVEGVYKRGVTLGIVIGYVGSHEPAASSTNSVLDGATSMVSSAATSTARRTLLSSIPDTAQCSVTCRFSFLVAVWLQLYFYAQKIRRDSTARGIIGSKERHPKSWRSWVTRSTFPSRLMALPLLTSLSQA